MIVIEIQNAEEFAKQKSWFKTFLGKAFGVDIERRVHEEVAKQIREELVRQGVQAEVSVKLGSRSERKEQDGQKQ